MRPLWVRYFCAALALMLGTGSLMAAELKLELRLIWCTNDDNYKNPKHKKVDAATTEKFRKVPFKWKHYFEINRVEGVVPSRGTKPFKMSDKCTLEITELEGPKVAVTMIGDGKPVNKTVEDLSKGKWITIGGDDKDGTGWFVLLTDLDEK